jgi:hypothetical protein
MSNRHVRHSVYEPLEGRQWDRALTPPIGVLPTAFSKAQHNEYAMNFAVHVTNLKGSLMSLVLRSSYVTTICREWSPSSQGARDLRVAAPTYGLASSAAPSWHARGRRRTYRP